jgi:hypothetical protein
MQRDVDPQGRSIYGLRDGATIPLSINGLSSLLVVMGDPFQLRNIMRAVLLLVAGGRQ